ncbi:MAG: purine-binding chemotaxis protein CheW [Gammaproteobacteria bacterium]|nr:purine-binding chemotaxis protein CheW [Gammaproteobacteria bacterium]
MLYLLLRMGTERYALEARRIVEVVPLVTLKPLPHTPACVAGLFDYRGTWVPVIDLCQLTHGQDCAAHLTTRIVLVKYPAGAAHTHILGLLAEQVTETVKFKDADFQCAGLQVPEAPYLGQLVKADHITAQHLEIEHLLPDAVRQNLFPECA